MLPEVGISTLPPGINRFPARNMVQEVLSSLPPGTSNLPVHNLVEEAKLALELNHNLYMVVSVHMAFRVTMAVFQIPISYRP